MDRRGRSRAADFHFVKRLDKSSPVLFIACATGQHYKAAAHGERRAGQKDIKPMFDHLPGLPDWRPGAAIVPMDQVSLNFTKRFVYKGRSRITPDAEVNKYDFAKKRRSDRRSGRDGDLCRHVPEGGGVTGRPVTPTTKRDRGRVLVVACRAGERLCRRRGAGSTLVSWSSSSVDQASTTLMASSQQAGRSGEAHGARRARPRQIHDRLKHVRVSAQVSRGHGARRASPRVRRRDGATPAGRKEVGRSVSGRR
jgi:hypothetical protein